MTAGKKRDHIVGGASVAEWIERFPVLEKIVSARETFWRNPSRGKFDRVNSGLPVSVADLKEAADRLDRFAPYIAEVFPETRKRQGIIESPVTEIPGMKKRMETETGLKIPGSLHVKRDDILPISGSVKARGGIYEVLKHAEKLAVESGMISPGDDCRAFAGENFKRFFSRHSIETGSTGNLGLSIGIMASRLGFKAAVHMSADAMEWKKEHLRRLGVDVIEYRADYSVAVKNGRRRAMEDPSAWFVDDENSVDLFLGYAVAALRLERQLAESNVRVDENHPLFVYLPCGVGGAAGGITFGLKTVFQDDVHCFFAEPTHSPCMLTGMVTGLHDRVSVKDFGLDCVTAADGLAVGRPSGFVGKNFGGLIGGIYTVDDDRMFFHLRLLADSENIFTEPSAAAAIPGPLRLLASPGGRQYLEENGLTSVMRNAAHLVWSTGGGMAPPEIMKQYYERGMRVSAPPA